MSRKKENNIKELLKRLQAGDRLALARTISMVENRHPELPFIMGELFPKTGSARVIGITGPPGAGKSTLVDHVIKKIRNEGNAKVAVIAVDPSSPFSGGAVLGDRIRMQDHSQDPSVYIRSLGTRGQHGGLSLATREVSQVLDAVGFDYILVETAGVGQTELEILRLAQTVLVVLVPESGDAIQVMKAGLMEIADAFVVNKADRPQADRMVKELKEMVGLASHFTDWEPPVLKAQGNAAKGVKELFDAILAHGEFLKKNKKDSLHHNLSHGVLELLTEKVSQKWKISLDAGRLDKTLQRLADKKINPYQAVDQSFKVILDK